MIAMVKGTLMEKSEGEAVVMTAGGLGLRVMCSMNTLAVLPAAGQECTLYTLSLIHIFFSSLRTGR